MKKKSMIYPVVFMFVITAFFTLALSILNNVTAESIKSNQEAELRKKILYVFDLYKEGDSKEDINKKFEEAIEKVETDNPEYPIFKLNEGGSAKAYAIPFDGPGLWGSINGYIGVTQDMKTITGIEFISQNETPGLGGRISEAPYKEQFRNVDISQAQGGKFVINRPASGGNIDAIAGATQTSTFVVNMINSDLDSLIKNGGVK